MADSLWEQLGSIMALLAIGIAVTITVFGFWSVGGRHISLFSGDSLLSGVQLLSRIMIAVVLSVVLKAQRTWMGRLFGSIALVGAGLHLLLVDMWLTIPLLNQHPHLLAVFFSMGGPMAALGLIGGIGLGVTTVRYRELEGWASKPLLWQLWAIIGGSVGFLLVIFLRPQTNLLAFLLIEGVFIVVPMWAFFAGTALGLLRSSLHAHHFPEMPQTSNPVCEGEYGSSGDYHRACIIHKIRRIVLCRTH